MPNPDKEDGFSPKSALAQRRIDPHRNSHGSAFSGRTSRNGPSRSGAGCGVGGVADRRVGRARPGPVRPAAGAAGGALRDPRPTGGGAARHHDPVSDVDPSPRPEPGAPGGEQRRLGRGAAGAVERPAQPCAVHRRARCGRARDREQDARTPSGGAQREASADGSGGPREPPGRRRPGELDLRLRLAQQRHQRRAQREARALGAGAPGS